MKKVFADSLEIQSVFSPARTFPNIASLIAVITSNAFFIAGIIAFIFIIVGGFGIIRGAGSGDPKKMEQAKYTLTYACLLYTS
ncbi:MAG: hypothetical protein N3A54_06120, partial [Patescibacteria group bacterium]|nr:hypothetical protein [Patescibacteria group bacterium]